MAFGSDIAPRVRIDGLVHRIEKFETMREEVDKNTGEVTRIKGHAARVWVLTPEGGFAEIYYGDDDLAALPAEAPDAVSVWVDASIFTRSGVSKAGNAYKVSNLSFRFVKNVDVPARAGV